MESMNQDVKSTPETQQQNPAPTTPTEAVNSGSPQSATVPQTEVNKLVGKARIEGRASALTEFLSDLGVASEEDLKALITDARKRKEADMSESDKAKAELERERKAKSELEQQLNAERLERRNDRIETELRAALTAAKANNPKTVLSYILVNHRDAMQSLLTDDGKIDDKAMTALVETVKKEDATLFTPPSSIPGSRSNADGRHIPSEMEAMKRFSLNNQRTIRGG